MLYCTFGLVLGSDHVGCDPHSQKTQAFVILIPISSSVQHQPCLAFGSNTSSIPFSDRQKLFFVFKEKLQEASVPSHVTPTVVQVVPVIQSLFFRSVRNESSSDESPSAPFANKWIPSSNLRIIWRSCWPKKPTHVKRKQTHEGLPWTQQRKFRKCGALPRGITAEKQQF